MRDGVSGSSALTRLGVTVGTATPLPPTLDLIATDPAVVRGLPAEVRQALVLKVAAVLAALAATGPTSGPLPALTSPPGRPEESVEWLNSTQVEQRFGLTRRWLADHASELRRLRIVAAPSRKVRIYHAARLRRYLEARSG